MKFFGKGDERTPKVTAVDRITRHSSGWAKLLQDLQERESLRILDFGMTSPANINFVTGLGHSIYMADVAQSARDARWTSSTDLFEEPRFAVEEFLDENLSLGDRQFDLVLLWDTVDYLPEEVSQALVARLRDVMVPDAQLLGFFHLKPESESYRYHLRSDSQVEMQHTGNFPVPRTLTSRQVESLFAEFSTHRFFLAKDNLREVLVTR